MFAGSIPFISRISLAFGKRDWDFSLFASTVEWTISLSIIRRVLFHVTYGSIWAPQGSLIQALKPTLTVRILDLGNNQSAKQTNHKVSEFRRWREDGWGGLCDTVKSSRATTLILHCIEHETPSFCDLHVQSQHLAFPTQLLPFVIVKYVAFSLFGRTVIDHIQAAVLIEDWGRLQHACSSLW